MNSRSRKILNMIENESQPNIFSKNSALVETWLENFDAENQDNDHDYHLQTSPSLMDNICSTPNFDIPDKNEVCVQANVLEKCLSTDDKLDSTLSNVKTNTDYITTEHIEHDAVATNIEISDHSTDNVTKSDIGEDNVLKTYLSTEDKVDSTVSNNDTENMPTEHIKHDAVATNIEISNHGIDKDVSKSDNGEDFSGTDGSQYEPPKKKPKKGLFKSARSISSSGSSSSSSGSSSSSSGSSTSSSTSNSSGSRSRSKIVSSVSHKSTASNITEEQEITVPKSRKRTRNPSQWKKNQRKYLKNTGQTYTSVRGKVVPEKTIRPPCPSTCRLSCSKNFSSDVRNTIFKTYWGLGSFQRQRDFLASCVKQVQPEFRTVKIRKDGDTNRQVRKLNTSYFLVNDGKEIRVCKTFLLNTLSISNKPLRTVIDNKFGNVSVIPTDNRGKHGKQSKLDPEIIQSVRDHINAIPRVESHYCRANSSREYIDGALTVAELHRNYRENRIANNKTPANYDAYHRIFNTQFNISFFVPRKDQCDVCEAYKNAVDKEPLTASYNLHKEEKSLSRIEKKQDTEECKKQNTNVIVAMFDLQAVLPCPIGQSSAFYYKSKLNCYNFTVTNFKDEKTFCFFWHEGLGKRGANEIGTCVYNFLKECSSNQPDADIIFYSDNCCGQQKNKFIFSMYYYAVSTLPINTITHKFLIRGHTQNEADTVHSVIEKNIGRAKKSGPIYTPEQYVTLIRNAKKTGNKFIVNEMNFNDFYDLKLLSNHVNLNTMKNVDGEAVRISDIKVIKFSKNSDTYSYKTTYKTELWSEAKLKVNRSGKKNIKDINLTEVYTSKLAIANNKKQDIMQLINSNIVPKFYENVYISLFD